MLSRGFKVFCKTPVGDVNLFMLRNSDSSHHISGNALICCMTRFGAWTSIPHRAHQYTWWEATAATIETTAFCARTTQLHRR